jgi:hypothetical protein
LVHGFWFLVSGAWFRVEDLWFMVHGAWLMLHSLRCRVSGSGLRVALGPETKGISGCGFTPSASLPTSWEALLRKIPAPASCNHRKRVSVLKLSGDEVSSTNAKLLLVKIMLCSKLHYQKVSD